MLRIVVVLMGLLVAVSVNGRGAERKSIASDAPRQRYIVELDEAPLVNFAGVASKRGGWRLAPTSPQALGETRLAPQSPASIAYLKHLGERRQARLAEFSLALKRHLRPVFEYQYLGHGFALDLTASEAFRITALPGVARVVRDRMVDLQTDAGPAWIGAPRVWEGNAGEPANLGAGVVVGVVDSGVNWDHPAFADIAGDGHDHINPRGRRFGLCARSQVRCNDKLIGVHDFTEEGEQLGRDVDGHGSHVASTAVGNTRTTRIEGITASIAIDLSGVAPRANLISYKACVADDPNTPAEDDDGCPLSAILRALDQVAVDQPDVVNYSLGGGADDPWDPRESLQELRMLNLRAAGILVVAAAGNGGPTLASTTAPATAPWVLSVANVSHDRRFTNALEMLVGGSTTPPDDLFGVGLTGAFGPARIVHAKDYGNALCGTGTAELQPSCNAHTGSTNPFAPDTFDGEIVVCDRGIYGRVEKGFNLRAAGAGGYLLANTNAQGESIVADDHCLPAVHLGAADGRDLRRWLDSGSANDHSGRISGLKAEIDAAFGDVLAVSSSRGPNATGIAILKPELAAPGSSILAAGVEGDTEVFNTGTSMASPHVAGSAALLLHANPGLSPAQLHSILVTTASNEGMRSSDMLSSAGTLEVGGGRTRVDRAIRAGLFLDVATSDFRAANPALGGDPENLNLPTMASDRCFVSCRFTRTVTDLVGGGTWRAEFSGAGGVTGLVEPATFTLAANGSRSLGITIDVSDPRLVGTWVGGTVTLANDDPDVAAARLPFSVFASGGALPQRVSLSTSDDRGQQMIELSGLVALPEASYGTLGLSRGNRKVSFLREDPTPDDPYDDLSAGVALAMVNLLTDGGMVIARTVPGNNGDLNLFVGRDRNGDGQPTSEEELCRSVSVTAAEQCVVANASAGSYWIVGQNRTAVSNVPEAVEIRSAAVEKQSAGLVATGPGVLSAAGQSFQVRLSWDEGRMQAGESWFGALIPKALRADGVGELGLIPIELSRIGDGNDGTRSLPDLDTKSPYALGSEDAVTFNLDPGQGHGRLFVDVPVGAHTLHVSATASGNLELYLVRQAAVFTPPDVVAVSDLGAAVAQQTQAGRNLSLSLSGAALTPGRYYIVPVNAEPSQTLATTVALELSVGTEAIVPTQGLWYNAARDGTGFGLSLSEDQLILVWYTYLEDGTPTWYLAQGPFPPQGNVWTSDLSFFNWNGQSAASTAVGKVLLTWQSPNEAIFSFEVNGQTGSERFTTIVPDLSCASEGLAVERTGLWFIPAHPGFGYSVMSLASQQIQINYLYDAAGFPRWVLGQGDIDDTGTLVLSQFDGFCPLCRFSTPFARSVGDNTVNFGDAKSGSVTTNVEFRDPVAGLWQQTGAWQNLTPTLVCDP